jgi:hypothetical protein
MVFRRQNKENAEIHLGKGAQFGFSNIETLYFQLQRHSVFLQKIGSACEENRLQSLIPYNSVKFSIN